MKLNLVHEEKSDIKYKIGRFPDGEPTFETLSDLGQHIDCVEILTRITCMDDLFILSLACDILERWEIKCDVKISYLLTQRMDRVMNMNRPFSLKTMIKFLATLNIYRLYIYEVHSKVTNNLYFSIKRKVMFSNGMCNLIHLFKTNETLNATVVFPDQGAAKRYQDYFRYKDAVCFEKVRDLESGKILDIKPTDDISPIRNKKRFFIIDDLCDGGSTFIKIKEYLTNTFGNDIQVDIVVYHIVNQKGIERLLENFDNVYTTNSYSDWDKLYSSEKLHVLEII